MGTTGNKNPFSTNNPGRMITTPGRVVLPERISAYRTTEQEKWHNPAYPHNENGDDVMHGMQRTGGVLRSSPPPIAHPDSGQGGETRPPSCPRQNRCNEDSKKPSTPFSARILHQEHGMVGEPVIP